MGLLNPLSNLVKFFLEEILTQYLITKNKVYLPNDFVQNGQKWILMAYPGHPLKGVIYLYQLNPFDLHWDENPYENSFYDLEEKKLIEYERVDLETYNAK